MKTFLLAWELGGGLGHVTRLRSVAVKLRQRGHKVVLAARDLAAARSAFADTGVRYLQAPYKTSRPIDDIRPARSFAHILHNVGFANADDLATRIHAWRTLFELVEPDTVLFDHSPTALLAARGQRFRRILYGDGFCSPPVESPFRDLRPWLGANQDSLRGDEQRTLGMANQALALNSQQPLARLADIYGDVEDNLLTTFSELDHFGSRHGSQYFGEWTKHPGVSPLWPRGPGKRVFAYLKPDPSLPVVLDELARLDLPSVVYVSRIAPQLASQYAGRRIAFMRQSVDLAMAAKQCDFAILNATHGSTAAMLLAGTPILQLPIYLEQLLVANNTVQTGAGLIAKRTCRTEITTQLMEMISKQEQLTNAAQRFARRYDKVSGDEQLQAMIERIDKQQIAKRTLEANLVASDGLVKHGGIPSQELTFKPCDWPQAPPLIV